MLYEYDYALEQGHPRHIRLVHTQLGRSSKYPNWNLRYIYDGPNLEEYINSAVERVGHKSESTDHTYFTVEGIMHEGYV